MTDQELQTAVKASRADWYARDEALGVTAPAADSWAARNPGADWAANEDTAASQQGRESWDWGDEYGTDTDHEADVA